jgi:hypothetical protein
MVKIIEIPTDSGADPRETLLLRLLHGGLSDREIAFELRGSRGFMEVVKSYVCRVNDLDGEDALRAFASEWCKANPLPVQEVLEVVKPPEELQFAVVHAEIRDQSCRHRIYLPPENTHDVRQRELLDQYVNAIIAQNLGFNFTGGSTINGEPAPGWDTLKKFWPRQLLLGKWANEYEDTFVIELSYARHLPNSSEMIRAMYVWLDAQFKDYAHYMFMHQPGGDGLIQLDNVPNRTSNKTTGLN